MTDPFARQLAATANRNGALTQQRLNDLEHKIHRLTPRTYHGRCALCGHPCKRGSRHCHAHRWAE